MGTSQESGRTGVCLLPLFILSQPLGCEKQKVNLRSSGGLTVPEAQGIQSLNLRDGTALRTKCILGKSYELESQMLQFPSEHTHTQRDSLTSISTSD